MKKLKEWIDDVVYNNLPVITGWSACILLFVVVLTLLIIALKWLWGVIV